MGNSKKILGVVVGRASENVQKVMLEGIIAQAEKYGYDVAVITNMHNLSYTDYFANVEVENKIFELMESPRLDGLIIMAETFPVNELQPTLLKRADKLDIPVVVSGDNIDGYVCVNNNVREDFREITRHLTEVHGFTDIHIFTGQYDLPTSHERVLGVRDVLEEKGIPFSEENVIYGNYWTTSGEALAEEYINGSRPLPQALICGNDFMAYGLMDKLFENDIKVTRNITIVGYEYVGERYYHYPILSTYARNRYNVGAKAVSIVNNMITGEPVEDISLKGCMVLGASCSCGSDKRFLMKELDIVRRVRFHHDMTTCGNFEHQLATCRSLRDYIRALQDYSYLIRDSVGIYLCLYENWTNLKELSDLNKSSNNEMMTLYRIISPVEVSSEPHYYIRKMLYPDELYGSGDKKYIYFTPMFTNGIEFGYFIFQYTKPDGTDPAVVDWINSAVNALNVLRMKNDINELLEYSNLNAYKDTATGVFNKKGFIRELENAISKADKEEKISAILLKTRIFSDESRIDDKKISVKLDIEEVDAMKKLNPTGKVICGKLADKQFLYAVVGNNPDDFHDTIADRVKVLIEHAPFHKKMNKTDNIITGGITLNIGEKSAEEIIKSLVDETNNIIENISLQRKALCFPQFSDIRTEIYNNPEKKWDAENECRDLHLSCGHFRAAYKNLFGISFHQDLIQSRISLAKYLLMTTSLNLPAIALKCGYEDDKYFLRQFRQQTGLSPNTYRKSELI